MWGSRPSHFMIIPLTKRHPNNIKADQLPISEVVTGLPRPYHHNNVWRQKWEAKRARLCQPSGQHIVKREWRGGERARLFQIPRHHTLHPRPTSIVNPRERPTRAQQRVVAARRGSASTAVPETAASYTQPRGPAPRTTTCGGRKGRKRGYGCPRYCGIIYIYIYIYIYIFESVPKPVGTACARKRAAIVDADRIDGIETIGRLEIDRGRIVLLKLAAKAGGYILILKGHPPATTEEVLLSFHRSFK